ncbi:MULTISPECIES: hypothetical protein [unclassified Mycobacterium]|uniref:hypothetical protein n=1 Tax=unclassified Mycobacterium TaxID=2642494 RepID=UPI000B305886|nr:MULTISPECIES: hypothetical protein [unclassified Mycobacterium]
MADLVTRAQIALLADLLEADPAALASLEHLGADGVRALRCAMSDALFDSLASVFARVSKLAPLVPNAVVIAVAHKAVPPEVAGRAGGALGLAHEDRAVGVLSGMKPAYLADAAPYVDPRIIPHFAPKLPSRLLIPAAKELLRRREYLTASRFVEYATEQHIVDFEKAIDDDEGLIRTGALVWDTDVLNAIVRVAGPTRLVRMTKAARAGSTQFALTMLSVLARIQPELASPAVEEFLGNPDTEAVSRLVSIAEGEGALAELLDLAAVLTDDGLRNLASAPILEDQSFAGRFSDAADTADRRKTWKRIEHALEAVREPVKVVD